MSDDVALSRLQATIAALRYWAPAIKDAARVEESEADGTWQLSVSPLFREACPFTLNLTSNGLYSLTLDGISYPREPVRSLDIFLPLVEAIADGAVVRRQLISPNTGVPYQVQTLIKLASGEIWSSTLRRPDIGRLEDPDDAIRQDRHYLPYRR